MNQPFWTCSSMNGDTLKDSPSPPPCGANNETALTETRLNTQVKYQQKKSVSLVSQIRGSELTVIYIYIFIG